jgi:hypothetical protein
MTIPQFESDVISSSTGNLRQALPMISTVEGNQIDFKQPFMKYRISIRVCGETVLNEIGSS